MDAALRLLRDEVLPVYDNLRDGRSLLLVRLNLAVLLLERGHQSDLPEARDLLRQAWRVADQMQLPEAAQIRTIQARFGWQTDT